MTMDAIYEEHGPDWSHQVSVMATTQWLQRDQTLPLSAKGVACETRERHHEVLCAYWSFHTWMAHWKVTLSPPPILPPFFLPCRPVHGLIFLYKWRAEDEPQGSIVQDSRLEEIFFAKQVG